MVRTLNMTNGFFYKLVCLLNFFLNITTITLIIKINYYDKSKIKSYTYIFKKTQEALLMVFISMLRNVE